MNNLTQKVDHYSDRTTQKILVYQAEHIKIREYKSPIAFQKIKNPRKFKPFGGFFLVWLNNGGRCACPI